MKKAAAFTLIELLIVVAIIAILAVIAVPNFLLAQTRAKISRVLSDQRSLATAMEAYCSDVNYYPAYGNPQDTLSPTGSSIIFMPTRLTTPVAYLTGLPVDGLPGYVSGVQAAASQHTFYYRHNYAAIYMGKTQPAGHVNEHFHTLTNSDRDVQWEAWSFGPDIDDDHGTTLYDATNGTISNGDIMRFGP